MSTSFLHAEGLAKIFPGVRSKMDLTVFDDVHFTIEKGEFVCIIGHSGCGKTTILNVLAGLDTARAGKFFREAIREQKRCAHDLLHVGDKLLHQSE